MVRWTTSQWPIALLLMLGACVSCYRTASEETQKQTKEPEEEAAQRFCQELDDLSKKFGSVRTPSSEDQNRAYAQVRVMLSTIGSEATLPTIYKALDPKALHFAAQKSETQELQALNVYFVAQEAVVTRLSEAGSTQSGEILVGILTGQHGDGVDGDLAEQVSHAISVVGKPALPYLSKLDSKHKRAFRDLIECVRAGKLYGP